MNGDSGCSARLNRSKPFEERFRLCDLETSRPCTKFFFKTAPRSTAPRQFDGCDRSTRESLTIGLRSIQHPDCRRALDRLRAAKP